MSNPISSNNPPGGIRQPSAASARPPDTSAVDQSAAEFAALLGAEPPPEPKKADDEFSSGRDRYESSDSSGESRTESRGGEQRVSRRERRGDSDDSQSGEEESAPESPFAAFGDAILDGLSKTAGPVAVETTPPADGGGFEQVVQQICDKILVSEPGSGVREVRIMLKESALPGTEIRLIQDAGRLQVQFITDNADVHTRLAQQQATLQALLNEKLRDHEVVVEVAMDSQSPDTGDGRSRERRDAKEEYERRENAST
jgi:type III secretion system needle length determinant